MPANDPGDKDGDERPLMSEPQLRFLKYSVITMGVMLFVGFLIIIGRIIYLIANAPPTPPPEAAVGTLVRDARLPLPAGAAVRHVSLSGNRLAVHYDTPAESAIVVLDLATGAVVSKVVVAPGK